MRILVLESRSTALHACIAISCDRHRGQTNNEVVRCAGRVWGASSLRCASMQAATGPQGIQVNCTMTQQQRLPKQQPSEAGLNGTLTLLLANSGYTGLSGHQELDRQRFERARIQRGIAHCPMMRHYVVPSKMDSCHEGRADSIKDTQ